MPSIVADKLLPALSWTLIHSLWQGLVLTVLAGSVVLLTKRSAAALRYALLCTLFFLFIGGVATCFLIELNASARPQELPRGLPASGGSHFVYTVIKQCIENANNFISTHTQGIVLTWLIVLVYKTGRMILDIRYLRRLGRCKVRMPLMHWAATVQALAGELGIRRKVLLMESFIVKVPLVIGHFKPLILVPAGMLTQMPPVELEAVLLHELAHIRRHDYLVNFIQCLSELIFFFNPGLLWVSSLLRVERENCCDDIAISRTSKFAYVEALIRCKEHSFVAPGYVLGLFGKKNLLLQRMTRIVSSRNKVLSPFETAFLILNLVIAIGVFSGMRKADHRPLRPVSTLASVQASLSPPSPPSLLSGFPVQRKDKENKQVQQTPAAASRWKADHTSVSAGNLIRRKQKSLHPAQSAVAVYNPVHSLPAMEAGKKADLVEAIQSQAEKDKVETARMQDESTRRQAQKDREQAMKDREQAEQDREQAGRDRLQAQKDREQASKDREQANLDRKRAEEDRALWDRDRMQALRDKQQLTYQD